MSEQRAETLPALLLEHAHQTPDRPALRERHHGSGKPQRGPSTAIRLLHSAQVCWNWACSLVKP